MIVLFIGDVIGKPGRKALAGLLPGLVKEFGVDLVIANGENAAGGIGITPETADDLLRAGVHVITTGNHIWKKKEMVPFMAQAELVLRPANYPACNPGKGWVVVTAKNGASAAVLNLEGKIFLNHASNPFDTVEALVPMLKEKTPILIVDIHAEATSEKKALGWFLDGRATAVLGTHTHVQTADDRILPGGTAYITDVGMTGPINSVIGVETDKILQRFVTGLPQTFDVASGPVEMNAVVFEADDKTGRALSLVRLTRSMDFPTKGDKKDAEPGYRVQGCGLKKGK